MVACNRVPRLLWSVGNVFLFVHLLLFHLFFPPLYLVHKHHLRCLRSSEVGWEPDAIQLQNFLYRFLLRYPFLIVFASDILSAVRQHLSHVRAQSSIYNALISVKWILLIVFVHLHSFQLIEEMSLLFVTNKKVTFFNAMRNVSLQ